MTESAGGSRSLALLGEFADRLLPHALRSLALRRGLAPARRDELLEEARQELALDCLTHDGELAAMPKRERHARWFRLVERTAYHACIRSTRRACTAADPDQLAARSAPGPSMLPGLLAGLGRKDAALVARIARQGASKRNGSRNLMATARRFGVDRRTLRRVWGNVADGLGFGTAYAAFWERRLAEALTGLAADLLRTHGSLHLWPGTRRSPPDPEGRMRRLRRIRTALQARPVDASLRGALAAARRTGAEPLGHACTLLDHAARLAPHDAGVQLWRYEALACTGRLAAAGAALDEAEQCNGDPVRIALARAQWHQRRGAAGRARELLLDARSGSRSDTRIADALACLDEVSPEPGPRPARRAPARSGRRRPAARRTSAW